MSLSDPPRTRLAGSTRFFARLLSFDLECPHCGDVYQIRSGMARKAGGRKFKHPSHDPNWDTWTARFLCTNKACGKTYVLGILAWPIIPTPHVASTPPADQVPDPRQLAQMRKEGGGWWLPDREAQRYPRPLETNLTTEEERPDGEEDTD
jgi:hypothetical protein